MPEPETIQTAAADLKDQWVKQESGAAPEAPAAPAAPAPAAAPVTETAPAAPAAPARGPDGKFVAAEPVGGVSAAQVEEFIEAQLNDQPYKIPKGLRLPLKRGNDVAYEPVEDVLTHGMLERDYRIKTAETAQLKREVTAQRAEMEAEQARVAARDQWLAEREAEMVEAQKDPAKWEAYLQAQALYQTNPRFRQLMDDALAKRETDAVNEVYQRRDYESQVNQGVELAASWIEQAAGDPRYHGVNPERVRVRYAQALASGQATLDPGEVQALFEDEAQYLTQSQGPLTKQLAELKAQIDALTASKGAEQHNAGTAHALQRAKAPPVAVRGAAPAPGTAQPQGKFGPRDLPERTQAWINQRD